LQILPVLKIQKIIDEPNFICYQGTLSNGNIIIACFNNEQQKKLFVCSSNKKIGEDDGLIHMEKSLNSFVDFKKIEMLFSTQISKQKRKKRDSCIIA